MFGALMSDIRIENFVENELVRCDDRFTGEAWPQKNRAQETHKRMSGRTDIHIRAPRFNPIVLRLVILRLADYPMVVFLRSPGLSNFL